jgi:hypothetical protein
VRASILLVLALATSAFADNKSSIKAVEDIVPARSKDGKRLALPVESTVDSGTVKHSYGLVVVDTGKSKGKKYALAVKDTNVDAAEPVDKQLAKSAPAVNKLLADGGFTTLPLVAAGDKLAPGLTIEAAVSGSSITLTAMLGGKAVGTLTAKDRGTPEMVGAVLVRGKPAFAYVALRWQHSTDGAVFTDDGWVAVPLKQVP